MSERRSVTRENARDGGEFGEFRKVGTTTISLFTVPPGVPYQTPEGLRAEDEETRIAFDVQGGVYPIRESVFQRSYAADALPATPPDVVTRVPDPRAAEGWRLAAVTKMSDLLCAHCGHHIHTPNPGVCGYNDCGCGSGGGSMGRFVSEGITEADADPSVCICTPDQLQGSGHGVNCPARPASGDVEAAWGALTSDLASAQAETGSGRYTPALHPRKIVGGHRTAIEAAIRAEYGGLDPVTLAKALRVIADIDYPVDWSNWLGGEGTASAALAGLTAAEAIAAEYERLAEGADRKEDE